MSHLSHIRIYPIKSLDGISVEDATLTADGALAMDRAYAFMTEDGRVLRAKEFPQLYTIRAVYDLASRQVTLRTPDRPPVSFNLNEQRPAIGDWLSVSVGCQVRLVHTEPPGFPDDPNVYGPTIVAAATFETVASWFPGLTVENVRRRFRANIEVAGVPAFWEEQQVPDDGTHAVIVVGNATLLGDSLCHRCVVPTRDPDTGEAYPQFGARLRAERGSYELCLRTSIRPDMAGERIVVGDSVGLDARVRNGAVGHRYGQFSERVAALNLNGPGDGL